MPFLCFASPTTKEHQASDVAAEAPRKLASGSDAPQLQQAAKAPEPKPAAALSKSSTTHLAASVQHEQPAQPAQQPEQVAEQPSAPAEPTAQAKPSQPADELPQQLAQVWYMIRKHAVSGSDVCNPGADGLFVVD